MSITFRPYVPEQPLLLPPDVREWLAEGHLAHHVSDLVDGLDLTAFYAPYEGDGWRNAPYGEPDERAQSNFTDPESGIMNKAATGRRRPGSPAAASRRSTAACASRGAPPRARCRSTASTPRTLPGSWRAGCTPMRASSKRCWTAWSTASSTRSRSRR